MVTLSSHALLGHQMYTMCLQLKATCALAPLEARLPHDVKTPQSRRVDTQNLQQEHWTNVNGDPNLGGLQRLNTYRTTLAEWEGKVDAISVAMIIFVVLRITVGLKEVPSFSGASFVL